MLLLAPGSSSDTDSDGFMNDGAGTFTELLLTRLKRSQELTPRHPALCQCDQAGLKNSSLKPRSTEQRTLMSDLLARVDYELSIVLDFERIRKRRRQVLSELDRAWVAAGDWLDACASPAPASGSSALQYTAFMVKGCAHMLDYNNTQTDELLQVLQQLPRTDFCAALLVLWQALGKKVEIMNTECAQTSWSVAARLGVSPLVVESAARGGGNSLNTAARGAAEAVVNVARGAAENLVNERTDTSSPITAVNGINGSELDMDAELPTAIDTWTNPQGSPGKGQPVIDGSEAEDLSHHVIQDTTPGLHIVDDGPGFRIGDWTEGQSVIDGVSGCDAEDSSEHLMYLMQNTTSGLHIGNEGPGFRTGARTRRSYLAADRAETEKDARMRLEIIRGVMDAIGGTREHGDLPIQGNPSNLPETCCLQVRALLQQVVCYCERDQQSSETTEKFETERICTACGLVAAKTNSKDTYRGVVHATHRMFTNQMFMGTGLAGLHRDSMEAHVDSYAGARQVLRGTSAGCYYGLTTSTWAHSNCTSVEQNLTDTAPNMDDAIKHDNQKQDWRAERRAQLERWKQQTKGKQKDRGKNKFTK